MDTEVVWNLDARARPELEVDIEIVCAPHDIPGEHHSAVCRELEVEIAIVALGVEVSFDEDGWFLADDEVVAIEDDTIYGLAAAS